MPFLAAFLPLAMALAGCGGGPLEPARAPGLPRAENPTVLGRSLFSKDATGSLTEDQLQRVLESPIDLQLPARVGIVPLAEPFDPRGPVSLSTRAVASRDLAAQLLGAASFSQVTEISTDLPNVGGIEGLRLIAARYRLRYLILYSQRFEDDSHANGWAFLYPTILGIFAAPGVTVESHGLAQADLVDVRTGTVLFSVTEPMHVTGQSQPIGATRMHERLQGEAATQAARTLAKRVLAQTNALIAWADERKGKAPVVRILPPPVDARAAETAEHAENP